jgi:hypothetical protein
MAAFYFYNTQARPQPISGSNNPTEAEPRPTGVKNQNKQVKR